MKVSEAKLVASVCRSSFYEFVREFWGEVIQEKPVWNWHIKYLCDRMQEAAERVFKGEVKAHDVVVNIPPGTTKSTVMSVMFCGWVWSRMPHAKVLGVSYAAKLAADLANKCRDVVISEKYRQCFGDITLREDVNAKHHFANTKGGIRMAAGVDGGVTGFHYHFIVIDDPVNPEEAASPTVLAHANEWIKDTLSNRKIDKRVTVTFLVMQRLHQDDPTAQFLARDRKRPGSIFHVCLPAENEGNVKPAELAAFYTKRLLDPVRLDRGVLSEEKEKGEYYYSSQFRQSPVPSGGGMFKTSRLKTDTIPTEWEKVVRAWDKAGTAGDGNWTVGVKMGKDLDGRYWVLDVIRVQLDSWERERLIRKTAMEDGHDVRVVLEQEGGSGGKESAENTAARTLEGFRVLIDKVGKSSGSKSDRADPFSVQVNCGNVYLPKEMAEGVGVLREWQGWAREYVEEMRFFPYSKYDDQVDSSSSGFNHLLRKRRRVGGLR